MYSRNILGIWNRGKKFYLFSYIEDEKFGRVENYYGKQRNDSYAATKINFLLIIQNIIYKNSIHISNAIQLHDAYV